jgi:gamma-butyrobetaine dioxygenase
MHKAHKFSYTPQYLGYHMDLLYFKEPPRLQILHCLRNSVTGGESFWTDSYAAIHDLWESQGTQDVGTSAAVATEFHYENDGRHYRQQRPLYKTQLRDFTRQLSEVSYSPPFQNPATTLPLTSTASSEGYLKLMRDFAHAIDKPEAKYERLMRPGEAMIFDNRRILHARKEFDASSGERWLKGAYIDGDPYLSKCRVMFEKHGLEPIEG